MMVEYYRSHGSSDWKCCIGIFVLILFGCAGLGVAGLLTEWTMLAIAGFGCVFGMGVGLGGIWRWECLADREREKIVVAINSARRELGLPPLRRGKKEKDQQDSLTGNESVGRTTTLT
jgi:hypothetical protein